MIKKGMNVLVTGATGFIGSHLCRALLAENHQVFALLHSGGKERIASLPGHKCLHLVSGDICSLAALQEIMKTNRIDAVIHLAAYATYGSQEVVHNPTYLESNLKGTLNVLQASLLARHPMVIYASSREVYGVPEYLPIDEDHPRRPLNFYGLTKLQGESYCEFYTRNYGLRALVLRYAGVYGQGKTRGAIYDFIQSALRGQPFQISSNGNQTRDFVYVGDVVSATAKALDIVSEVTFDILNIGGGRETSLNELATKVIGIANADIDFRHVPGSSDDRFVLDITKARRLLGYQPRSIEDALTEFVKLIKSGG